MEYPNKTYILEKVVELKLHNETVKRKHIVIVAANNVKTAAQYLKDKLGFNGVSNELVWLVNCNHTTMYNQTGNKKLNVQAKIMYNSTTVMK